MSQKRAKAERKAAKEQRGAQVDSIIGGKFPQFFYKYAPVDSQRIHDVLVKKQIWFADPETLNDPFDCRVVPDLSSPEIRREWISHLAAGYEGVPESVRSQEENRPFPEHVRDYLEGIRSGNSALIAHTAKILARMVSEGFGVCCLTTKPDNLPMWAHYADNHEGVCYQFDLSGHVSHALDGSVRSPCFPFTFLKPIEYQEKYRTILPEEEIPKDVFLVKSKIWEYESEWRALAHPDRLWEEMKPKCHPDHAKWLRRLFCGPGAYSFEHTLLFGVILGFRMGNALKQRVVAMAKEGGVKIFQARPKNFEYGLDIEPYPG